MGGIVYIKKLEIFNFRSYEYNKLLFVPGINVFYGENGSGKTNILESIYWSAMTRSFRVSDDAYLVKKGKETTLINMDVSDNGLDKIYSSEYNVVSRKKTIKENNTKIYRVSEMIGKIPVVLFSPENIMMIKGEPALRRKFIDDLISQIDKEYFITLNKYSKEIAHRNYLLKGIRDGRVKKDNLNIWNEQIKNNGTRILLSRIKFLDSLNLILKEKLSDENAGVKLIYFSKIMSEFDEQHIHEKYNEFFQKNTDEEIARATTLIGPHRDDLEITYKAQPAKQFASEGQQRISIILIKLAEGLLIKEKRGSYPVVLLDDFSSELDNPNRGFIGKTFSLFEQILVTTTYKENLKGFKPAKEFYVGSDIMNKI